MRRRDALKLAAASAILRAQARPPNVVFLFADDQRTDTIGALGNKRIRTPNIDLLVRSGFTFRNAYCLGSNSPAVCLPSRNMLLSGRAYFRFERYASGADPNFPDAMREAGYFTYHHGKAGNTAREIEKRFDVNKYLNDQEARTSGEPGKQIVDEAVDAVAGRRDGKPFFLYLAFEAPHDPRVAAERYMRMYQRDRIPLPHNYVPLHPFDNGEQIVRDELLAPFPRTEAEVRKHIHDYYAVITALDGHIGRLLNALKKARLYDNTIFVYSADHGLAIGSHGLFGKQSLYEHSAKAPLIFSGPGIPRGQSSALVYVLDIFPTVVDFAGGRIPGGLDGQSLKPVIDGRVSGVRPTLFTSYREFQRAVRDDRWKLIRYPLINRMQLFDLKNDPDELRDLFKGGMHAAEVERLTAEMRNWQVRLGDATPLESASPRDGRFVAPTAEEYQAYRKKWRM